MSNYRTEMPGKIMTTDPNGVGCEEARTARAKIVNDNCDPLN